MPTTQQIRAFFDRQLATRAAAIGRASPAASPELNLLESGLYDSLAFMELLTSVETELGVAIDLSDVDPERFTTLGGLEQLVAAG